MAQSSVFESDDNTDVLIKLEPFEEETIKKQIGSNGDEYEKSENEDEEECIKRPKRKKRIRQESESEDDNQNLSDKNDIPLNYDVSNINIHKVKANPAKIIKNLNESLRHNKISRKLFARAVLNMEEHEFKHYLYRVKNWDSIQRNKVKFNILKIKMWLEDEKRLEKLEDWKKLNILNNYEDNVKKENLIPITCEPVTIKLDKLKSEKSLIEILSDVDRVLKLNKISFELFSKALFGNDWKFFLSFVNDEYNEGLVLDLDWDLLKRNKKLQENFYTLYKWLMDENRLKKLSYWIKSYQSLNADCGNLFDYYSLCLNDYEKYDVDRVENEITPHEIASQIKEIMKIHNLTLCIISVPLLRSDRALSKMINEPDKWSKCGPLTKKRFKLLYMWLKDPEKFEKVLNVKESLNNSTTDKSKAIIKNWFSPDNQIYHHYSKEEKVELEKAFAENKYCNDDKLKELIEVTGLTKQRIQRWFAMKRIRNKNTTKKKIGKNDDDSSDDEEFEAQDNEDDYESDSKSEIIIKIEKLE